MKKILVMCLTFCIILSASMPIGVLAESQRVTKLLLEENFESGNIGDSLTGFNGWTLDPKPGHIAEIASDTDSEGNPVDNKVASFTKIWDESVEGSRPNTLVRLQKEFDRISSGVISFQFKIRCLPGGDYLYVALNGSKMLQECFLFSYGQLSGAQGSQHSSKTFTEAYPTRTATEPTSWYNMEFRVDLDKKNDLRGGVFTAYANGVQIMETDLKPEVTYINKVEIFGNTDGDARLSGGGHQVDDIYIYSVGAMEVTDAKPAADGALNKAEITFSNPISGPALPSVSVAVADSDIVVTEMQLKEGSRTTYILTFSENLVPQTNYNLVITGVEDVYGESVAEITVPFTTRNRIQTIGDVAYYAGYSGSKTEKITLTDGTITAETVIKNEMLEPLNAVLILVHKKDDKIIDAVVADASVVADSERIITATLSVSDVNASDALEVYILDSLSTLGALKPISSLKVEGIETGSLTENAMVDKISMNESIDFSDESLKISGAVEPVAKTLVTALVFKSNIKPEELTIENFKTMVDFIEQTVTDESGSYSFGHKLSGATDNDLIYACAGTKGANAQTQNAKFFASDTVNAVLAKVNSATKEELLAMLKTENPTHVLDGILLNAVLQMDMEEYKKLEKPIEVCKALAEKSFTQIGDIRSAFVEETAKQLAIEARDRKLIADINAALWDDLEKLLIDNADILMLPWDETYAEIKNTEKLKNKFYKQLASDYTFTDFEMLREKFEEIAAKVDESTEITISGGSGGGGGGGNRLNRDNFGYIAEEFASKEQIKPETTDNENKASNFNDLDNVEWARESIEALAAEGVISGMGDGKFKPDLKVTREQFVKMIVVAFGLYDEKATTDKFSDVSAKAWYQSYVASAVNRGIIEGIDNSHFGIGSEITRAEMAVILDRAATAAGINMGTDEEKTSYIDKAEIPSYAQTSINKITNKGIMSGVGDNRFAPREKATRAMAAKVIYLLRGDNK